MHQRPIVPSTTIIQAMLLLLVHSNITQQSTTTQQSSKPTPELRVMVIGNSLTFTGDVPKQLQILLQAAVGPSKRVIVKDYAVPSTNLSISANAMMDPRSSMYALIRQPWDVVVLQEQSQIPGRWLPDTTGDDLSDLVVAQTEELYRLVNMSLPATLRTRPAVTATAAAAPTTKQDFQWMVRT